jgi:hypothetical protein
MKKPKIKGFTLSTDYSLLWDLIQKKHRIPAWLIYSDDYEEPIWDLVEVKLSCMSNNYMIGTRGLGYEGFTSTLGDFCRSCTKYSLHFVNPTN